MNVLLSYTALGSTPVAKDMEDFVLCAFVDELVKMNIFWGGRLSLLQEGNRAWKLGTLQVSVTLRTEGKGV